MAHQQVYRLEVFYLNTKTTPKRVLVTGARAPVALHLCRLFHERGYEVYAADSTPYPLTKASNSIQAYIQLSAPRTKPDVFIEEVSRLVKKHHIDLLVPTCEESFYLSMYRERIPFYCDVFVGAFQDMKQLHNKQTFIQLAEELGFAVPKTIRLSEVSNAEHAKTLFAKDVVVKKIFSRFSDDVHFFPAEDYEPERHLFTPRSEWIMQEKIEGAQYCSYSIVRDGIVMAHTTYQTELTAGVGATIAFKHCEHPAIERFVKTIANALSFTGQLSFDFIVDENGTPYPIECNPRATSGLHLFSPDVVPAFIESVSSCLYPSEETKEAIKLAMLVYGWHNHKHHSWKELWNAFFTYRDITYRSGDMKPFFYQFVSMYDLWKESRKHGQSMTAVSTHDIRWDGEHS